MTTTITVTAIIGAILGIGLTRLWDFLWDAFDRRYDRRYAQRLAHVRRLTPELDVTPDPQPSGILRTKQCPEGFSAKQILGYGRGDGRVVEPQFPGGLQAWDRMHDAREVT